MRISCVIFLQFSTRAPVLVQVLEISWSRRSTRSCPPCQVESQLHSGYSQLFALSFQMLPDEGAPPLILAFQTLHTKKLGLAQFLYYQTRNCCLVWQGTNFWSICLQSWLALFSSPKRILSFPWSLLITSSRTQYAVWVLFLFSLVNLRERTYLCALSQDTSYVQFTWPFSLCPKTMQNLGSL